MRHTLVTGGAGFVGSNLVNSLLRDGHNVTVFDAFARRGARDNLAWLRSNFADAQLRIIKGDIRDFAAVQTAVTDAQTIYHLAGQVAVTSSVSDPRTDFEINVLGTLNVLEAAHVGGHRPAIIFTSTNKVYGGMHEIEVIEEANRYRFAHMADGIAETQRLDFHSPYGCSKGGADQYVRDYARIYNLPTVVFRMSCIYGPRQFGTEDQGWVAHFVIAALTGKPITIYGNGKQVRDILFIDDLVQAFRMAGDQIDSVQGEIFNIGGGPSNALSIWAEFGERLTQVTGKTISPRFDSWRPGDQPCYITNIQKARQRLGWSPLVDPHTGIRRLSEWVSSNLELFDDAASAQQAMLIAHT